MRQIHTWSVEFKLVGPISINSSVFFKQEKGFSTQKFYSDISIKKATYGLNITATAYAENIRDAEIAAHVYLGRMRDVLASQINLPLQLSENEGSFMKQVKFNSKLILKSGNFKNAFERARFYEQNHPKLLQAMGWYSKAKISHNSYDQFFAYWTVIEILAKEYHTENEHTKKGIINKTIQCFIDLFGPQPNNWPVSETWIKEIYNHRNNLYHGGSETNIEEIIKIASHVESLSSISLLLIQSISEKIEYYC